MSEPKTPKAVWVDGSDYDEGDYDESLAQAMRDILNAPQEKVEVIGVKCRTCDRDVAPMDRGIWLNDLAVCEKCAQEIWKMLESGSGVGRTI